MPTGAVCAICGSPLESAGASCPYNVPLDRAPGIGDPGAIAAGKLSHTDHELHIARWRIHHPEEKGATPAVMAWAREQVIRSGHTPPA